MGFMTIYDAAYMAAFPFYGGAMAWKRWRHGKYKESLPAMMGRHLPRDRATRLMLAEPNRPIWIHAVSVGEAVAAAALARSLQLHMHNWPIVVSTVTETGQAQARAAIGELAEMIFYAPFDFSWNVRHFANYFDPAAYVVMETELWPNILLEMQRRRVPAFLVNGRLNDKSYNGYKKLNFALRRPLRTFRACLMQTEEDQDRIIDLGVSPKRVRVMGNCKFDALPEPMTPDERSALRAQFGMNDEDFILVAGSTHPGEEEIIFAEIKAIRPRLEKKVRLRLIIAPRHPERFDEVADLAQKSGLRIGRFSDGRADSPDILILDTMGQLARWFGIGDAAFVGGSLSDKIGGHNLLEPAAHGIPVLHGPYMYKQPEIMKIINCFDAAIETKSPADAIARLIDDPPLRERKAMAAREAAASTSGSADKAARVIARVVEHQNKAHP